MDTEPSRKRKDRTQRNESTTHRRPYAEDWYTYQIDAEIASCWQWHSTQRAADTDSLTGFYWPEEVRNRRKPHLEGAP